MRNGCSITTTLLAKDTAHKTVFPVFTRRRRLRHAGDGGRRRFPDDRRSRRPFACCPGRRRPAGCCATSISATASRCRSRRAISIAMRLRKLADAGLRLSGRARSRVPCLQARQSAAAIPQMPTWPAKPPDGEPLSHGYHYLTETRFDQIEPCWRSCAATSWRSACRCARSRSSSARASASSRSSRRSGSRPPTRWSCSAAP